MIIFFGNGKTGNRAIQYGTVTIQHVVTRAKWLMPYASKGAQCLEDNLMYETSRLVAIALGTNLHVLLRSLTGHDLSTFHFISLSFYPHSCNTLAAASH
jgi:hypothetical protein